MEKKFYGLKNEFKIAMVNEPSVLDPLKFYSIIQVHNMQWKDLQFAHTLKDICPNIFLLNFRFLTKNYILNILLIYGNVLLSAKFIIYEVHWKKENLAKYIKAREWQVVIPARNEYWVRPAIIVNQNKIIS